MNFCSTCGIRVSENLSYCKKCGAKLNRLEPDDIASGLKPETLIGAMTTVFVLGLITIVIMMGVMKVILGLPVERVLAFALVPFLMLAILETVFIRLLFRRKKPSQATSDQPQLSQHSTNELDTAQARVLPEPISSVTDHTTRAFDPVYRERK